MPLLGFDIVAMLYTRANSPKVYPEPAVPLPPVYPGPPEKQILRFAQDDSQRGGAGYTSSESGLTMKMAWRMSEKQRKTRNLGVENTLNTYVPFFLETQEEYHSFSLK